MPSIGRTTREEIRINDDVIPANTDISVSILSVHRNPAYWENPTEFNPSRFESDEILKRNPFSYIPFSAGPRNCIGQKFAMFELKVFVYHVISQFQIFSTQSVDEVQPEYSIVLNPCNGIHMKFYSRR